MFEAILISVLISAGMGFMIGRSVGSSGERKKWTSASGGEITVQGQRFEVFRVKKG